MTLLPEHVHATWFSALTDADLVDAEAQLYERFSTIERREKLARGYSYDFFRGPADLMHAWDGWSRVNTAARVRRLTVRRARRV